MGNADATGAADGPGRGPWLPRQGVVYSAVVVGAGSWGTAMARHACLCGFETTLLCRRPRQADAIRAMHRNPDYLRDLSLPGALRAATYADHDLSRVDLLLMAVPSKVFGAVAHELAPRLPQGIGALSLTKGVEPGSLRRLSVVMEEAWVTCRPRVAVLSGPNHAEEVSRDQPTATVIASHDTEFALTLQRLLTGENFRPYVNDDLVGVELASAVKNVIALSTGMGDGLGFGDNARAALITRGLVEMSRLGVALGARRETFSGLAGLGDLVATCTSRHSRNRRAGELIAQGHRPDEVEAEMGMVAEGLTAAPAVLRLADSLGVEMPITSSVVSIIQGDKDPTGCVRELMTRQPRPERG